MSIKWIEASKQLADSLTKRGASSSKLNQVLVSGRLRPPWEYVLMLFDIGILICWLRVEKGFLVRLVFEILWWWFWVIELKVLVHDWFMMDVIVLYGNSWYWLCLKWTCYSWPFIFGFDIRFIGMLAWLAWWYVLIVYFMWRPDYFSS